MDPLFLECAARDFHLQPGSPIRDDGVDLAEVSHDFDGVDRLPGRCAIGAYEAD